MNIRHEDQQRRQQLLTVVDRGSPEQLFAFLQAYHRRPFRNLAEVIAYDGVIDDQIDFIDCTGTRYNVTPLIIAAGKGSFEKTKILLVHGANPNKQCSTGDTALNLAVHRQKYHIVELLLRYRANPNIPNQSGKTALHRAAVSYIDENANHIRPLLHAGADPTVEDRNQRTPLDEAVIANKPDIVSILLSHDRTLTQRAYRAAIIAARLGNDKCLEALLEYGMDPNIMDRTRTTPLHVAIRSLKLSSARLLISYGADQNLANNRGETSLSLAEYLQSDQRQSFLNVLMSNDTIKGTTNPTSTADTMSTVYIDTPRIGPSDSRIYTTTGTIQASIIPYVHPLIRTHSNWTLDSDEFRSRTDNNSSVQNLLDTTSGTYWCSTLNRDAWIIFDLKHQYNISGMRIIGCDNQSTPKCGHIDVSNACNGPWLKVKDFTCPLNQGNTNDLFFAPLKTRFIRVFISENYGGNDIRIQGIGFFGVDMRLVNLLREYGLERSLQTLLANGINDLETLDEKRDEILNSSDKYLDVNDHFQFIRLTESLRTPKLTALEWFNSPQLNIVAGEKLQTFSATGDEGTTNRVKLEEKREDNPQIRTVLLRDLEPIQGRSLVDFPDYSIQNPGHYKVRVVSVEFPNIQTAWQDIFVAPKPPSVDTQTSSGLHTVPPSVNFKRPSSTPPTDLEGEFLHGQIKFPTATRFRPTPVPYSRENPDDDDDSDSAQVTDDSQRRRSKSNTQRTKLITEGTQSEEKKTRNVGTMHEPVQTRNFGNEVQPQSSSTQTSFALRKKPCKTHFTFLERPDQRTYSRYDEIDYEPCLSERRSPSPRYQPSTVPLEIYRPRTPSPPPQRGRIPVDRPRTPSPPPQRGRIPVDRPRTPSPPPQRARILVDRPYTPSPPPQRGRIPVDRPRTPSPPPQRARILVDRPYTPSPPPQRKRIPVDRPYTPSPPRRSRHSSPSRRPQSATPRYRPLMYSQETDTSLDAMRPKQHRGVQYEPRSTREKGTQPSIRVKKPMPPPPPLPPPISYYTAPSPYSSLPRRHDRPETSYYIQPSTEYYRNNQEEEEAEEEEEEGIEEAPSMHDQSTMAELLVSLDHYTQCESQPYMADHYVQTTPTIDEDENNNQQNDPFDQRQNSLIRKLPLRGSISIHQPEVIQPPTLPRPRRSQHSPTRTKRDGLDYTGNNLEVSLHHGLQRKTSIRDSPLLNIGTEHILHQTPTNECTVPFETRYVYDSMRSSTLRSRRNSAIVAPVLNSPRTRMFTHSPVQQSRTNGNFFLSTAPVRSLNSSFHLHMTADEF